MQMQIQVSDLEINPARYFELAKTADVIVTQDGQQIGRIVCGGEVKTKEMLAFERLMELARKPYTPDDTIYDPIKEAAADAFFNVDYPNDTVCEPIRYRPIKEECLCAKGLL